MFGLYVWTSKPPPIYGLVCVDDGLGFGAHNISTGIMCIGIVWCASIIGWGDVDATSPPRLKKQMFIIRPGA